MITTIHSVLLLLRTETASPATHIWDSEGGREIEPPAEVGVLEAQLDGKLLSSHTPFEAQERYLANFA